MKEKNENVSKHKSSKNEMNKLVKSLEEQIQQLKDIMVLVCNMIIQDESIKEIIINKINQTQT